MGLLTSLEKEITNAEKSLAEVLDEMQRAATQIRQYVKKVEKIGKDVKDAYDIIKPKVEGVAKEAMQAYDAILTPQRRQSNTRTTAAPQHAPRKTKSPEVDVPAEVKKLYEKYATTGQPKKTVSAPVRTIMPAAYERNPHREGKAMPAQKTLAIPASAIVQKQTETLDSIIKEFDKRLKDNGYSSHIEVYDARGVLAYSDLRCTPDASAGNLGNHGSFCSFGSSDVLSRYNSGMNTTEIKRAAKKAGVTIKDYEEITDNLADAILNGGNYARQTYNKELSDKLGATDYVLNAYASGKSYSEIIGYFKEATRGMNISKSTIKRLAKKYDLEKGTKIRETRRQSIKYA